MAWAEALGFDQAEIAALQNVGITTIEILQRGLSMEQRRELVQQQMKPHNMLRFDAVSRGAQLYRPPPLEDRPDYPKKNWARRS
jgi:hypothetical protein